MKNFQASLSAIALLFLIYLLTLPVSSHAQEVPRSVEAERLERSLIEDPFYRPLDPPPATEIPETKLREKSELDEMFFTLEQVGFRGNSAIDNQALAAVFSEFLGTEISVGQLYDLVADVTKLYRDEGYVLSQAYLPPQEIENGRVVIHILEGYIDQFILETPDGPAPRLLIDYAYKIKESRPLKMAVLEHYMLLANEIPGFSVTSVLKASEHNVGAAKLYLTATKKPFSAVSSIDNFGTRDIGPLRIIQSLTVNPLSDRTDSYTLYGATTPKDGELKFIGITYDRVITTSGTRIALGARHTHATPDLSLARGGGLGVKGISKGIDLTLTQPLIRKRHQQMDAYIRYDHVESQTNYDPAFNILETEDRLRVIRAGLDMRFQDRLAAFNSLNLELSHGLNIFNANGKQDNTSRGNAKAYGFTKFNVTFDRIQQLSPLFSVATGITGQYSPSSLLSYEEFGVGGRRFGRGYDSSEITGASGAAAKIELRYNSRLESKLVQNLQFYTFYDFGTVWDRNAPAGRSRRQSLASVGIGTRFIIYKDMSADMFLALPISRSVASRENNGKDVRLMFAVTKPF